MPICSCPADFSGKFCENKLTDPCENNPCKNNGLNSFYVLVKPNNNYIFKVFAP